MKRLSLIILLLLSLVACSPQSEDLPWTWTFSNGNSVQFPDKWLFAYGSMDVVVLKDSEGYFPVSLGYYPNEEASYQHSEGFEEGTLGDNIRLLRKEELMETPIDGIKEAVRYRVIYPNLEHLSVNLPKTANIAEREHLFSEVAISFQASTENVVAFWGGYAGVMPYPADWELYWNMSNAPYFRSEQGRSSIWFYEDYKLNAFFDIAEDATYAERAESLIAIHSASQAEFDSNLLETREVDNTTIVIYNTHQAAFSVDGMNWFYVGYDLDDDEVIFEMIQAIIETYHFSDIYAHLVTSELEATPESTEE